MSNEPRTMKYLATGAILVVLTTAVVAADNDYLNTLRVGQNARATDAPEASPPPIANAPASPRAAPGGEAPATPQDDTWEDSERRLDEVLSESTEARFRDPTEPSEAMRELVDPLRMEQQGGTGGLALPRVVLRGRIIGPAQTPGAMIEIEQALYVIETGTEITVPTPNVGLGSVTLRVTELTAQQVRIEVMPLRQVIVLR